MSRLIPIVAALGLFGCDSGTPTDTDPVTPGTTVPTGTDTDVVDTDTDIVDTDVEPEIPVVDCSSLPQAPFSGGQLPSPRSYHGLDFDKSGNLISTDGNSVYVSTSPSDTSLLVPVISFSEQLVYLPDGRAAGSINGNIEVIDTNGERQVVAGGINAYGVEIGPDGFIYTANQQQIHRVDPEGVLGPVTFLPGSVINSPKVIEFSLDGRTMYVGTNNGTGAVYQVDLDLEGQPILPPMLIGNTIGSWHDGIELDACGNLYVAEFFQRSLSVKRPGQPFQVLIDYGSVPVAYDAYGHGIAWGSGIGEWASHSIYIPLPYANNRVAEVQLGMPGKNFNDGVYDIAP